MNLRKYIILFFLIYSINSLSAQTKVEPGLVKWYTIEEADSLFKIQPKPIFIDVYTDWCSWCKHMMKTTFANKGIANYINNFYYPVRFDAEGFDTIKYQGKIYTNKGVGSKPKHEFASFILKNRYSFPTIVYIDKRKKMYQIPGYMNANQIEPVLVYFVEEIFINVNYNEWETLYQFNYEKKYKEELSKNKKTLNQDTIGKIKWYSTNEASNLCIKNKKPMLLYFYSDWCNSCKVLEGMVLKNPILSDLINENFYPVKFNAASQEEHIIFNQKFDGTGLNKPHKIAYSLLQQNFQFPAFVIINSKKQKLNEIHGFLSPKQIESILSYFVDNIYMTKKFEDFLKTFKGKIK